ncbi:MAG: Flp pilus assembly protein CpaB [Actinomycetota bacterium]|nr:Flp pilus assembly protein CpaB [Actinomycetota bacterium]
MTYRVRNIVIAVVLAAMAALLTSFYVTNYKKSVQQGEELEQVWVAKTDIPAGTRGDEAVKLLTSKSVASRTVVPGAISDPKEIVEKVASQPVFAGEQVTVRRFTTVSQQGIYGKLKGNLRAVQVTGTPQQLLAGTLRAGDHVDVVASFQYKTDPPGSDDKESKEYDATRVVLRDVEVLAVSAGSTASTKLASNVAGGNAILLALTDAQENKLQFTLSFADSQAGDAWALALRPPVEDSDSPESVETLSSVLRDGLSRSQIGRLFGTYGS